MNSHSEIVGVSSSIRATQNEILRAARSDAKVLITGESGVGKEVVARLIHQESRRCSVRLVTINCAGIPDSLLETEMFGHVRGSFTDAHRDKRGWLETADNGTIFMDEIGEMSLRMQALMLRFLETGEIQRVGSHGHVPALNVRVITATHRRLLECIASKSFREDLYYRLNVIHIEVPALRERVEDIGPLLAHFLVEHSAMHGKPMPAVSRDAMACLTGYSWPGNVRELKNVAERLILRADDGDIGVEDLPAEIRQYRERSPVVETHDDRSELPVHVALLERVKRGESFWSTVYEPFLIRDMTREDLRSFVRLGLEETHGSYKLLVANLNLPPADYKRFMAALRKHQCHLPFQQFRAQKGEFRSEPDYTLHAF